jgi:hypothetical protein
MAVGDADIEQSKTDHALKFGGYVALGALAAGVLLQRRTLRNLGAGAALAVYGVRLAAGTLGSHPVAVAPATPAAASGWPF